MSFKFPGKNATPRQSAPTQSRSIPEEVLRDLSPEAAERLRGYVDASENFRRSVYGDEVKSGNR